MTTVGFLWNYKWYFIIGWTILTGIIYAIEVCVKKRNIIKEFIIRRIEKKWKNMEEE